MGTLASGSIDLNSLQVAGKPNKYITDINENGITIHPELIETDSYYTIVNGNGLKINKVLNNVVNLTNDTTVAEFSADGAQIGSSNSKNIYIDNNSMDIRDEQNVLATFGTEGAQIGLDDSSNVKISTNSIQMIKDGLVCTEFSLPSESPRTVVYEAQEVVHVAGTETAGSILCSFDISRYMENMQDADAWFMITETKYDMFRYRTTYNASNKRTWFWYGVDTSAGKINIYYNGSDGAYDFIFGSIVEKNISSAPCFIGCNADMSKRSTIFAIGNGESNEDKSNAMTVDWTGNLKTGGNITVGGDVNAANGEFSGTVTMEDHATPVGWYTIVPNSSGGTIDKLHGTSFASISGSAYTPTAGRWLVMASARYSGASSGNRGVCIYQGGSVVDSTQVLVPAIQSSSWSTDLKTIGYFNADGSTEFRIGLLQNSGSSLSTTYTLTFIRIR